MENLNMALVSSSSSKLVLNYTNFRNPAGGITGLRRRSSTFALPFTLSTSRIALRTSRISASSRVGPRQNGQLGAGGFASLTSSGGQQTSSVGVNSNLPMPPPSSNVGSPLFWVGVGVGLSALFSFVASRLKQYAMQQVFKGMMNQMNTQNNPFGNGAFPPGSPFPFPTPPAPGPTTPYPAASQPRVTVDIPATTVEAASTMDVKAETEVVGETTVKEEPKKYAFVDVSPEETMQRSSFENEDVTETSPSKDAQPPKDTQNGAAFNYGAGDSQGGQSTKKLTVDTLEKLMEDPHMQKMVYPSLPEEMRNPTSFKWMLQNPEYRKQLQEMLDSMGENGEWDSRVLDSLKNFDLDSAEVKQQFEQIGLTPEEVVKKMMANPEIALGFQNPRVQAAIMDCSQNPMNIIKYQNDKEVMAVITKISELFPGATGIS